MDGVGKTDAATSGILGLNLKIGNEIGVIFQAISNEWYYQMFYDDLPFWSFVGKMEKFVTPDLEVKLEIFTHLHFNIHYNKNRVIEIAVTPENPVDISENSKAAQEEIDFSYSVEWTSTETTFKDRLQHYKDSVLSPIHLEVGSIYLWILDLWILGADLEQLLVNFATLILCSIRGSLCMIGSVVLYCELLCHSAAADVVLNNNSNEIY